MKVVLLTTEDANQAALAWRLREIGDLAGIVLSSNVSRRRTRRPARRLADSLVNRTVGAPLTRAWFDMLARYEALHPTLPDVPVVRVGNINDEPTQDLLNQSGAELAVVSGTNIVGAALIEFMAGSGAIVNLHTGISPYVKGGPNCTNWCLAQRWFHLIGNTVMWLDPGVDSGPLIATERTRLWGTESLVDLHWAVMNHAHDLCCRAVARVVAGGPVARVDQAEIGTGTTFRNADWTAAAMLRAWHNHARHYSPQTVAEAARLPVRLVDLSEAAEGGATSD